MDSFAAPHPVILRISKVEEITGYKKSSIYKFLKTGDFPTPLQLGPRRIGFRSDEIEAWIKSRPRVSLAATNRKPGEVPA